MVNEQNVNPVGDEGNVNEDVSSAESTTEGVGVEKEEWKPMTYEERAAAPPAWPNASSPAAKESILDPIEEADRWGALYNSVYDAAKEILDNPKN